MEVRKSQFGRKLFATGRAFIMIYLSGMLISGCGSEKEMHDKDFSVALENGKLANESYDRCLRLTKAWIERKDINIYNREPELTLKEWIDSEIKVMWGMQQENGIVGGGWPDGNFSRTNIMYSLWKTQGTHVKISLHWILSSNNNPKDYYFKQTGDKFVIEKFFDTSTSGTILTFEKIN